MVHSRVVPTKWAVFAIAFAFTPTIALPDPLTELRCQLATRDRLRAEAEEAADLLALGHAALFAPPKDWICTSVDLAGTVAKGDILDAEFACERGDLHARVHIGGAAGVNDAKGRVEGATPKTFRRNQHLFARGPWKLATVDGAVVGVLSDVATVEVAGMGEATLSEDDLIGFVASLNRLNQNPPDLMGAERSYREAKDKLAVIGSEDEADLAAVLEMMPSVVSLESLGFETTSDEVEGGASAAPIVIGITKTLPWTLIVLGVRSPGEEIPVNDDEVLHRCIDGQVVPPGSGACLTHKGLTYWFGTSMTELPTMRSGSATIEIGETVWLRMGTFGPAGGPMSDEEIKQRLARPSKIEDLEGLGEALFNLVEIMGSRNDPDNLPQSVNTILDQFEAQRLMRLDIARYPVGASECN